MPLSNTISKTVLLLALIILSTIIACYLVISAPTETITYFLSDDAYYYLLTARNIVNGYGPTFDGLNQSNGFHPLWMVIILPVYNILHDLNTALKGILLLQVLLNVASFILCYLWCKAHFNRFGAFIALIILFLFYSPLVLMLNGLESALSLNLILLILFLNEKYDYLNNEANVKTRFALGIIFGFMVLARLDTIFILFALVILKIIFPGIAKNSYYIFLLLKKYSITVLAFILVLVPYFLWNYIFFDHLLPISGAIKSTFPSPLKANNIGLKAVPFVIPFFMILTFLVYSVFFNKKIYGVNARSNSTLVDNKKLLIAAMGLGCGLHIVWTRLFMSFGVYQWHFVTYIPVLVFYLTSFILFTQSRLQIKNNYFKTISILLLFIIITIYNTVIIYEKGVHHQARISAAKWVQDNLPANAVLAMSDAGVFAYFNNRKTINLDGLINGYGYQYAIMQGEINKYFLTNNVKYIADAFSDCDKEEQIIRIFGWRGKNYSHPIGYSLTGKTKEAIYKGNPTEYRKYSEGKNICFMIWKFEDMFIERFE